MFNSNFVNAVDFFKNNKSLIAKNEGEQIFARSYARAGVNEVPWTDIIGTPIKIGSIVIFSVAQHSASYTRIGKILKCNNSTKTCSIAWVADIGGRLADQIEDTDITKTSISISDCRFIVIA